MIGNFIIYTGYSKKDEFQKFLKLKFDYIKRNSKTCSFFENNFGSSINIDTSFSEEVSIDNINKDLKLLKINDIINLNEIENKNFAETLYKNLIYIKYFDSYLDITNLYQIFMSCISLYSFQLKEILYDGPFNKIDIYILYLLACFGSDVALLDFDKEYKNVFNFNLNLFDVYDGSIHDIINYKNNNTSTISMGSPKIVDCYNVNIEQTSFATFLSDFIKTYNQRILKNNYINVYSIAILGCLENFDILTVINHTFLNSNKPFIKCDSFYCNINLYSNTSNITFDNYLDIYLKNCTHLLAPDYLIKSALSNIVSSFNNDIILLNNIICKFINFSTYISSFLKNNSEIPLVLFYGELKKEELLFLDFLSNLGFDTIFFSSNYNYETLLKENNKNRQIFKLKYVIDDYNCNINKLPTFAYNAEKNIREYLTDDKYNLLNYQIYKTYPITLNSTFDEIFQLWEINTEYRPGFSINDNIILSPVFFTKISGTTSNIKEYWNRIGSLLYYKPSFYFNFSQNIDVKINKDLYKEFILNNTFDCESFKNSVKNPYKFLKPHLQDFILSRIQYIYNNNCVINYKNEDILEQIIYLVTHLKSPILNALQEYDATKKLPKIILIDTSETVWSLQACLLMLIFHFLCFDVLIFSPNGYSNIENYINPDFYTTFDLGNYYYKSKIPNIKPIKKKF